MIMMTEEKRIIRLSVRNLVEFLLRSGSLELKGGLSAEAAMLEGARVHRSLQKKEGPGYRAEVPLIADLPITLSDGEDWFADKQRAHPAGADSHSEKAEGEAEGEAEKGTVKPDCRRAEKTDLSDKDCILRIEGRADGIYLRKNGEKSSERRSGGNRAGAAGDSSSIPQGIWVIDEIKTVHGAAGPAAPEEVHLAQARCYAHMYASEKGLEQAGIRMTYCSRLTGEVWYFYEDWSFAELDGWFRELIRAYIPWIRMRLVFENARADTLRKMVFPFPYRKGQYELAAGVYRTIVHGRKLFLQAPTGTGKTLAVLFPALKALSEGKAERIFYLTAKAVTGRAAVEALTLLKENGLNIRSLVLTSRERACPCETVNCSPLQCPKADGHYDRVNTALRDLLLRAAGGEVMTAKRISVCAGEHRVCPYELALDASDFADVIICDYNYVFHPQARLTRFFGEAGSEKTVTAKTAAPAKMSAAVKKTAAAKASDVTKTSTAVKTAVPAADPGDGVILLIDEAHNLLERGREMYSASLSYAEVRRFRKSIKTRWPRLWKSMKGLTGVLRLLDKESQESGGAETGIPGQTRLSVGIAGGEDIRIFADWTEEEPEELLSALRETGDMIRWILEQEGKNAAFQAVSGITAETDVSDLLEFYFGISHFQKMLEEIDGHYIVYSTRSARRSDGGGFTIHLFCADPSGKLRDCMAGCVSSVLFSATFLPIQYYKGLLGGTQEDFEMYARSSFPPARQKIVIIKDVTSRYRDRNTENYEKIARSIGQAASCRPGNYMAFFPSYTFLENVFEAFCRIFGIPPGDDMDNPVSEDKALLTVRAGSGPFCAAAQKPKMTEQERAAFLEAFEEIRGDRFLVGFCVMGGMFGEGIDLRNDRLIGSFIVGTGIPPVDSRRELLRKYFAIHGRDGYDFAYRFPGMNKVLQAAGRVIRTESDLGVILLLDGRFGESANRVLFPAEWGDPPAAESAAAARIIRDFWTLHTDPFEDIHTEMKTGTSENPDSKRNVNLKNSE